jgi:hypothetical protein
MNIVERLRAWAEIDPSASQDLNKAANEIERLQEEVAELKYKEAYASRAYMAARRMLDERGVHMDYFLSRANYESEAKEKK